MSSILPNVVRSHIQNQFLGFREGDPFKRDLATHMYIKSDVSKTMGSLVLGTFLGQKESMNMEYKEFCMKDYVYNFFSSKQIHLLLHKCIFPKKFNDIILYNIHRYMEIYIPKYMSAFHNCSGKHSEMNFMIGVNDFAEITGIPFHGSLVEYKGSIQRAIRSLIEDNVTHACCMHVELDIQSCNIEMDILDDTYLQTQLNMQRQQQHHCRIVNRKYNKKRKQWIKLIMKYKGKLQNLYDDLDFQEEFCTFLKERGLFERYGKHLT